MTLAEADELYEHKNYSSAMPVYLEHLKKDPQNARLNYRIGAAYLQSRSMKQKAAEYLEKAMALYSGAPESDVPADLHLLMGDAHYVKYNIEGAVREYEKHLGNISKATVKDEKALELVNTKLGMCNMISDLKQTATLPISSKTGNPCQGEQLNGPYSKSLSPDKTNVIYTFTVPVSKASDDGSSYFEPVNAPKKDSLSALKDRQARKTVNKNLQKDSVAYSTTIGKSYDGQVVLTYKDDHGEGNLYISRLKNNLWTNPQKIRKQANLAGWENNEFMTADGSALYFSSDRPGGFGGSDLYRCHRLPNGQWSKAVNLGPDVNTTADEEAPFMHPDGVTLYFSSNRIKADSYDIFSAKSTERNSWSKAQNVGYPINRNDNDIFQVTADNKKVYPSAKPINSKRDKKEAEDSLETVAKETPSDNFLITFMNQENIPLTLLKGKVTDIKDNTPPPVSITVYDNKTGEITGKYHSEEKTGSFSFIVPFGRNNNVTYEGEGFVFQSENLAVDKDNKYFERQQLIKLQPIEEGAETTLSNVFFEKDKTTPTAESKTELENLHSFLSRHPEISVELTSTIFAKNQGRFYKRLARDRSEAIASYLISKGISKKRIETEGRHSSKFPKTEDEKKKLSKKEKEKQARKFKSEEQKKIEESRTIETLVMKIVKIKKQES
jgi:outer membrane protein OmpA-like peptidoglycan-associated protein